MNLPFTPKMIPPGPPRSSLFADLATSLLTQVFVVLGNLAALRLAAHTMGPDGVGQFALVRRVVVCLAPLTLLGLGVGLPRTLARVTRSPERRAGVMLASWLIGLPALGLVVAACATFPGFAAHLFFGTSNTELLLPLVLLMASNQAFFLTYGALRGDLQIRRANLVQIAIIAVLPPTCVVWLGGRGPYATLVGMGIASTALAAVAGGLLLHSVRRQWRRDAVRVGTRELLSYGLPRMPGDLALTCLYAIGPILAAHMLDLTAAGLLAIGMSLVSVLSAAFGPLGLVLLPRLSRKLASSDSSQVATRLPLLLTLTIYGATFLAIVGSVFGNGWLEVILGADFRFDPTAMTLLVLAASGNVVFVLLRSVLDATSPKPRNAVHAFVSLAALLLVWFASQRLTSSHPLANICFATAASFTLLAGLTLLALTREFRLWPDARGLARWGVVHLVVGSLAFALRCEPSQGLARFLASQLAVGVSWAVAMHVVGARWGSELYRFMRPGRPSASHPAAPLTSATATATASTTDASAPVLEGSMAQP